jgi:hypothetical protein
VLHEAIPPVRSVAAMVPAALEAVVAKALERDRAKRYVSAAEFADALERASRVVGALGTHKDVAMHLDAVLGTEISAQRDAVRAWLARSEPSHHGVTPPPRSEPGSVTRVEGRGPDRTPSSVSRPRLPEPVPEQGPPSGSSTSSPSTVSSVSSAVIPAPEVAAAPAAAAAATAKRARVWPWAVVAVAAAVAGIVWMRHSREQTVSAAAPAAPPPPVSAVAVAPPPPSATMAAPGPSVVPSTIPSAASPSTDAAPTTKPPTVVSNPQRPAWRNPRPAPAAPKETATAAAPPAPAPTPTPTPAPAPTPAPVPDDISRNPYR